MTDNGEPIVRIFVKGAPEIVLPKCTKKFDPTGKPEACSEEDHKYVLETYMKDALCKKGLRCIAFGYKDMPLSDFDQLMEVEDKGIDTFDSHLTFVALVALEDPLRDDIKNIVQFISGEAIGEQQINIRLITGDNIETARCIAEEAGIISAD